MPCSRTCADAAPRRRGSGDPVGGLRVGADTDPGHGHDRLDIAVVHALDDDRHVQAVVDQGIESEIRGIGAQLRTEVGQGPTRPVRMAGSERDADTRPARSAATFSHPEMPRSISATTRSRTS